MKLRPRRLVLLAFLVAFIQPGKPALNAFGESFNGKMRNEWLNAHWWRTIVEARRGNEEYRTIHNTIRPHRSLGKRTPAEAGAEVRGRGSQRSGAIAIVDLGASYEVGFERTAAVIIEHRERAVQPAGRGHLDRTKVGGTLIGCPSRDGTDW